MPHSTRWRPPDRTRSPGPSHPGTACGNEFASTPLGHVMFPAEDSPRGLGRTLGKRVGGNPSRVRISYPPPVPHRARCRRAPPRAVGPFDVARPGCRSGGLPHRNGAALEARHRPSGRPRGRDPCHTPVPREPPDRSPGSHSRSVPAARSKAHPRKRAWSVVQGPGDNGLDRCRRCRTAIRCFTRDGRRNARPVCCRSPPRCRTGCRDPQPTTGWCRGRRTAVSSRRRSSSW